MNKPIYCPKCHHLLLKAAVCYGEVKCHKCKELVTIKFVTQSALTKMLTPDETNVTMTA